MFTPDMFQEEDFHLIKQLIDEYPLATIVVASVGGTEACHVPLYWEDDDSEYGMLCGHVAKTNLIHTIHSANHQWLIIFQDMGHYISPNWYPTKWVDHKAVPTWNYRSVHLRVKPTITTDPNDLARMVGTLSDMLEQEQPKPWALTDAPSDYLSGLYRGIVGFTLKIIDFQAQFKLSQNKSTENKQGIISNLQQLNTDAATRMAALVRDTELTTDFPEQKTNHIDSNTKTVQFDVPDNRIHFETFGGESINPPSNQAIEGVYADLSVNLYRQTHELNVQENETVLEAMLNAGIHSAPYSCQSGVCGSCKAQLTEGKVAMKNRTALSDEDIENGEILTCQAVCQSEKLTISFE